MTESEKMALRLMPYTCPHLDRLGKDCATDLSLNAIQRKTLLEFIEKIKREITCPMRTALEQACKISLES